MSRLAIDLVSPLPPVRSGIADYAADLLDPLAELCDLRLVRLPGLPVAEGLERRFELVSTAELGASGRLPVHQMGNNEYHRTVWDLALEHPGVMTLHDLVLHHLLVQRTLGEGDADAYRRELEEDHGWIGAAAADVLRWPGSHGSAAQFALPAHARLLTAQRGVLVHSAWAARTLREEIEGLPVEEIPMGIPLPARLAEGAGNELRRSLGIPDGAPVLASVGFQTPIKRTDVAVRALADPRLAEARLLVAGQVAPTVELERVASEAGVGDRVHVLGYVPFRVFEEAIAAADVCLNLRYPTAGETSASLLRILAVGRPVVVSDHAQFAELDLEGVARVPLGDGEVEALVAAVVGLLGDRRRSAELARSARRRIEERHRPVDAARALVEACTRFRDGAGESARLRPRPGPSSLGHPRLPGRIEVEGVEGWSSGERRRLGIRLHNEGPAVWLAGERPEGGVALEVRVWSDGRDLRSGGGWLGLPFDVAPGDEAVVEVTLRRPVGLERLEVVPHVLGRDRFGRLGGPEWSWEPGVSEREAS